VDKGNKNPEDNLITVMTSKEVTKLYKTLLEIIEDLRKDHEVMMAKVAEKNGEEFARSIDFFTSPKYEQIRKRVLDNGNECERSIIHFLSFFDSTVNVQKVNEAARQKIVTKKTFISQPVIV
jgi:translation initiation factor 2 alpha subunit (eIF-2alpha)